MADINRAEECYRQNDYANSITHAKECLFAARRDGNRVHEKTALKIIAWSYYYIGNYHKSVAYGEEGLKIAKEEEDKEAELAAYDLLARSFRAGRVKKKWIESGLKEPTSDIADGDGDAAPKLLQKGSLGNDLLA